MFHHAMFDCFLLERTNPEWAGCPSRRTAWNRFLRRRPRPRRRRPFRGVLPRSHLRPRQCHRRPTSSPPSCPAPTLCDGVPLRLRHRHLSRPIRPPGVLPPGRRTARGEPGRARGAAAAAAGGDGGGGDRSARCRVLCRGIATIGCNVLYSVQRVRTTCTTILVPSIPGESELRSSLGRHLLRAHLRRKGLAAVPLSASSSSFLSRLRLLVPPPAPTAPPPAAPAVVSTPAPSSSSPSPAASTASPASPALPVSSAVAASIQAHRSRTDEPSKFV